jgi:tetratricopeptide (TPR) repeat protein
MGKFDLAVRDYTEAIKLNPKNAESYNNRANAYSLLGKYDDAIKDYDEALKLEPKNARIYANRGAVKLRLGKSDEATKDLHRAVELEPGLKDKIEPLLGASKPAPNKSEK